MVGSMNSNWKTFKQTFLLYITAVDATEMLDKQRAISLLTTAESQATDIDPEEDKIGKIVCKSLMHTSLQKENELYEEYYLNTVIRSDI